MYDTNITPFQFRYGTLALNPQILKTRKRLGQELKGCVIYVVKGSLDWCINWSIGIDYSYIKKSKKKIDECVCVCVGGGGGGGFSPVNPAKRWAHESRQGWSPSGISCPPWELPSLVLQVPVRNIATFCSCNRNILFEKKTKNKGAGAIIVKSLYIFNVHPYHIIYIYIGLT